MIKTLLVEDHVLTRMGLAIVLDKSEDISIVAQAENGAQAIELAKKHLPDVIVMDIGLPIIDGIEATRQIKDFNPDIKILIFTSKESESDVFDAFKSGADGYVMKDASEDRLITAIKSVKDGVAWLDPNIAKIVLSNLQTSKPNIQSDGTVNYKAGKDLYGLTEREMDVLALIVDGLTNTQIADKLTISAYTAKAHVHSVLQKLSAPTRAKATRTALLEGLV